MKSFITSIVLLGICFLNAQTINAQYLKAKKGDVVYFDEAVITNLPTYRLETRKIKLMETLIDSQNVEIDSLRAELQTTNVLWLTEQARANTAMSMYAATKQVVEQQKKTTDELIKINKRQNRLYNRKEFWAVLGLVGGFFVAK